jgi:hypothetical protein
MPKQYRLTATFSTEDEYNQVTDSLKKSFPGIPKNTAARGLLVAHASGRCDTLCECPREDTRAGALQSSDCTGPAPLGAGRPTAAEIEAALRLGAWTLPADPNRSRLVDFLTLNYGDLNTIEEIGLCSNKWRRRGQTGDPTTWIKAWFGNLRSIASGQRIARRKPDQPKKTNPREWKMPR